MRITMTTTVCQEEQYQKQQQECEKRDSSSVDDNHHHCNTSTDSSNSGSSSSSSSNRVLFVQKSFGDYGVALFCPLLDIQEKHCNSSNSNRNSSNDNNKISDNKNVHTKNRSIVSSERQNSIYNSEEQEQETEEITTTTIYSMPSLHQEASFLKHQEENDFSNPITDCVNDNTKQQEGKSSASVKQNSKITVTSSSLTSIQQHVPETISKSIPLKQSISSSSSLCPTLIGTDDDNSDDNDNNDDDSDSENDTTNANNHNSQEYTSTNTCSSSSNTTIYSSLFVGTIKKESMDDMISCPPIVSEQILYEIQYYGMTKLLHQYQYQRCFCIGIHGDSFITLLNNVSYYKYTLLIIKTTCHKIFGGFASEPWQEQSLSGSRPRSSSSSISSTSSSNSSSSFRSSSTSSSTTSTSGISAGSSGSYYGNGLSFLFAVTNINDNNKNSTTPTVTTATSTKEQGEQQQQRSVSIYPWSGTNNYCQICDIRKRTLCMGGVGDFGLLLQNSLTSGRTGSSETYNNPPLLSVSANTNTNTSINNTNNNNTDCTGIEKNNNDGYFTIADFEIYGLAPLSMYI